MFSSTRVLVTGAGGFIGSHLVDLLVREGYRVRALTRHTSENRRGKLSLLPADVMDEVEVYQGDLRDADAVSEAIKGMDTVFHLGAITSVSYSFQHPEEVIAVNTNGTLNVLQAMRRHGTRRGVIVSSSEVYGSAKYVPIDEKHPLQPQSPYAASKISAEAISMSFERSFKTPVVVVRPFDTYGPWQDSRAVLPSLIIQALTRDVVSLGATQTIYDYTYVADTVRGIMLASKSPNSDSALGEAINLGTGHSLTIEEVANRIVTLTGRSVEVTIVQDLRPHVEAPEVLRLESDNRRAAVLIGWQPETTFDVGLQATINWVRSQTNQPAPSLYPV